MEGVGDVLEADPVGVVFDYEGFREVHAVTPGQRARQAEDGYGSAVRELGLAEVRSWEAPRCGELAVASWQLAVGSW